MAGHAVLTLSMGLGMAGHEVLNLCGTGCVWAHSPDFLCVTGVQTCALPISFKERFAQPIQGTSQPAEVSHVVAIYLSFSYWLCSPPPTQLRQPAGVGDWGRSGGVNLLHVKSEV